MFLYLASLKLSQVAGWLAEWPGGWLENLILMKTQSSVWTWTWTLDFDLGFVKNKTVKNWKERKVQVNPNQFTIKELWERKSRALRNDQLKE